MTWDSGDRVVRATAIDAPSSATIEDALIKSEALKEVASHMDVSIVAVPATKVGVETKVIAVREGDAPTRIVGVSKMDLQCEVAKAGDVGPVAQETSLTSGARADLATWLVREVPAAAVTLAVAPDSSPIG